MNPRWRLAWLSAALVTAAGVSLGWPGLPALDAGDFATAVATNGVPHATGFPLYLEATRLWTWLPIGNLAARYGAASALWTGVAVGCAAWLAASGRHALAGACAAASAAIATLTVDTLALHARVAEVYALQLALAGLGLVALERWSTTGDARWRSALALIVGLGLANHALFRLWTPVFVVAAVLVWRRRPDRGVSAATGWPAALLCGALPIAGYGLLVVSAAAEPAHNWGDPSNLARLWDHATAADIRAAFGDQMRPSLLSVQVHGGSLARQFVAGLGVLAPLGVVALVAGAVRTGVVGGTLLALVAVDVVYAVVLNPMGLRDAQNGQLSALALATGAGWTIGWVVGRVRHAAPVAVALLLLSYAGVAGVRYGETGRDWSAEDVAAVHLALAEPESITASSTDTTTAALLYASVALDARPDALVLGRHELSHGRAAAAAAARSPFPLAPAGVVEQWRSQGRGDDGARAAAVLAHARTRALYWEVSGNGDELPATLVLAHRWPIGRVFEARAAPDECAPGPTSLCTGTDDAAWGDSARAASGQGGYFYRAWIARQWGYRGWRAFRSGAYAESGTWFERAARLAPDNPAWTTGVAVALANTGRLPEALAVQRAALRQDPLSRRAVLNAIRFAEASGDTAAAAALRRHAARVGALD